MEFQQWNLKSNYTFRLLGHKVWGHTNLFMSFGSKTKKLQKNNNILKEYSFSFK